MPSGRWIGLVYVMMWASAFTNGAFPALLPDIGRAGHLADWQLGTLAGAFGFARLLTNVPAGLFITHHLRRAMAIPPVLLVAGALCLSTGGPFGVLVLGRALMGAGLTLNMLSGLTAILTYRAGAALTSSLNVFELAAMVGMLGGVSLISVLPRALSWNAVLLIACAPLLLHAALLPFVLARLPRRDAADPPPPMFARGAAPAAGERAGRGLLPLAFAAGGAAALGYATIEQFILPVRGSREFGLDRVGIAHIMMVAQACDIAVLLPVGAIADRHGPPRVLAVILATFAAATALISFGGLPLVYTGAVLLGLSMAGWMLPVGILRSVTPSAQVAWRTALYRMSVD
ncbi:MAG TPA: MFS transporter, partial [Methylomirabilota bacterium]|nr:MFS transporter [Methylomirabilota bacterium]